MILKNGGLIAGQSYYVEGTYAGIRGRLRRLCKGQASSDQSGNGWMITPKVDIPVPHPPTPITIPVGMPTRATIEQVVAFLKTRAAGSQCGMTAGPKINRHLTGEFTQRGIRVSCEGPFGNRIITLVAVDNFRVEQLKAYKGSKRTTDQYLIGTIKKNGGIPANEPTYVQGNRTTLVRQLINYVGPHNYSAKEVKEGEDQRGPGWIVTVKIPILP